MSDALNTQIRNSRLLIRRLDAQGQVQERDHEEARLSGLLDAWRLRGGTEDATCPHAVHRTAGLDGQGKTLWRCVDCGVVQ